MTVIAPGGRRVPVVPKAGLSRSCYVDANCSPKQRSGEKKETRAKGADSLEGKVPLRKTGEGSGDAWNTSLLKSIRSNGLCRRWPVSWLTLLPNNLQLVHKISEESQKSRQEYR